MPEFRVVLKVPATLYVYYNVEAESVDELGRRLQDQEAINEIVANQAAVNECSEVDESPSALWEVDEIGAPVKTAGKKRA